MRLCLVYVFCLLLIACGGSKESSINENIKPTLVLTSTHDNADEGQSITITAIANDVDGQIVRYQWEKISGPNIVIPEVTTTSLTIIAPAITSNESLILKVIATDNDGAHVEQSITVQLKVKNNPPNVFIYSSHETAFSGTTVELNSEVIDESIDSVTYSWQQIEGPELILSNTQLSSVSFVVPEINRDDQVLIQLEVTDNAGLSDVTDISITLQPKGQTPPEINPLTNELNLIENEKAILSVWASDIDGEIVSYKWQQISGPNLAFTDTNESSLSITVPDVDIHQQAQFEVTVIDNDDLSSKTTITVNLFPSYQVTTLQGRDDGKGVDLIILGDGFTQSELGIFEQASNDFINDFKTEETINKHYQAWNIHRIDSISTESGSDFPEDNISVNTVFDSYFQCANIARLLCINSSKVLAIVAKLTPQFDQVIVIVNSSVYGGSGGQVATFSLAQSATNIAIHELGHSFAGLADEYTYGASNDEVIEPYEPNATTFTDPKEVKWRHWFEDINQIPTQSGELGVGLFEGARYHEENYFRPLDNSIMKELSQPFGAVNAEAWALNVYETAGSVYSVTPNEELVVHKVDSSLTFAIELIQPLENIKITWWINDVEQESDLGQLEQLTVNEPISDNYKVKVEIVDNTGLIRQDTHKSAKFSYTWTVSK